MADVPKTTTNYVDKYFVMSLLPLNRADGRREAQLRMTSGGVNCEVYLNADGARWIRGTLEAWAEWLEGAENG